MKRLTRPLVLRPPYDRKAAVIRYVFVDGRLARKVAGILVGRHLANYCLPSLTNMDMLDTNDLGSAIPEAAKRLNLNCISSHQSRGSRSHHCNVAIAAVTTT